MRLFGYYAWHSFLNQIKKLFRTWVIIFILACALGGGVVGFVTGNLADKVEQDAATEQESGQEPGSGSQDYGPYGALGEIVSTSGLDSSEIFSLAAAGIVIVLILYFVGTADKGGSIFLPADVALLFPSPLKPQSVLIFRLFSRVMLFVIMTIYMVFALSSSIQASPSVVAMCAVAAILALITAKAIQVFFYLRCEADPKLKRTLRYVVIAVAAMALLGIYSYSDRADIPTIAAASQILNAPGTDYIPVYGWLKGIVTQAVKGNLGRSLVFTGLSLAEAAGLFWIIYRQQADFYESAMEKTEVTAKVLEKAAESRSGIATSVNKKHSESSRERQGIGHGWGASVFFFKAMHARLASGTRGLITKTNITYLAAALIGGFIASGQWGIDGSLAALAILMLLVFWRSMANPLAEDTRMGFFVQIPESPWKKLFFSLMGGTANCLIDLIPAIAAVTVAFRPTPLMLVALVAIPVTTDLYATLVSAFLDASIPQSVDRVVRQMVQIIFIYFGMVPDIVILAYGYAQGTVMDLLPFCAVLNLTIAAVFFAVTPLVMEDMRVRPAKPGMAAFTGDLGQVRRQISTIAMGMTIIIMTSVAAQYATAEIVTKFYPWVYDTSWGLWALSMVPQYVIGFPAGLLLLKRVKPEPPPRAGLGTKKFAAAIPVEMFLILVGSLIGTLVLYLISLAYSKAQTAPAVGTLSMSSPVWIRLLFMVIIAPLIEEFTFRKVLIDRIRPYGETTAIFFSALVFGLFHGNFAQMFYAFGIGLLFGAIYEKTGRLRYTIVLHMGTNLLGGIVMPDVANRLLSGSLDVTRLSMPAIAAVAICYYLLVLAGMVIFIIGCVRMRFTTQRLELPRGKTASAVYGNFGMIIYYVVIAAVVVVQLLP